MLPSDWTMASRQVSIIQRPDMTAGDRAALGGPRGRARRPIPWETMVESINWLFALRRMVSWSYRVTERCENELGTLIVEGKAVVELESFTKVHPARNKQVLTYLRLGGMKLGCFKNFGVGQLKA
jgi:hypothetical protein